jgi:uncharacterized integral membrane protein
VSHSEGPREPAGDWTERREGPSGKVLLLIVALVLLALFVLQNTNDADINFLFWDVQVPLWIVIVVSAALGVLAGWTLAKVRRGMRRDDR